MLSEFDPIPFLSLTGFSQLLVRLKCSLHQTEALEQVFRPSSIGLRDSVHRLLPFTPEGLIQYVDDHTS